MMSEISTSMSINEVFKASKKHFENIVTEGRNYDEAEIVAAIESLANCHRIAEAADLFSSNEDIEEYTTESLKFLFLEYYMAKTHSQVRNLLIRAVHLEEASKYYNKFIDRCMFLGLLNEDELKQLTDNESGLSAEVRRNRKISQYKREKETKARMEMLQQCMLEQQKRAGDNNTTDFDNEEELRELSLLELQTCAREAIIEVRMIKQEVELLQHMAKLRDAEQAKAPTQASPSSSSSFSSSSSATVSDGSDASLLGLPSRPEGGPAPGSGPGLSVTRTAKVGDQIIMSRETIKSTIFTPRMAPPTMTPEEYGDLQKADALERQRKEQQSESHVVKRYAQLEADGEEDNDELVDKATNQDREWDAWKEDNPKGWGNKMGKRF